MTLEVGPAPLHGGFLPTLTVVTFVLHHFHMLLVLFDHRLNREIQLRL